MHLGPSTPASIVITTTEKKTMVLNISLAHKNGNIHTANYNDNNMNNDMVWHHFHSVYVNDRNTDSQSKSIEF